MKDFEDTYQIDSIECKVVSIPLHGFYDYLQVIIPFFMAFILKLMENSILFTDFQVNNVFKTLKRNGTNNKVEKIAIL